MTGFAYNKFENKNDVPTFDQQGDDAILSTHENCASGILTFIILRVGIVDVWYSSVADIFCLCL